MAKDLYKWIGSSTWPRKDGNGAWYVLYLAEKQPDGSYRPMTTFSQRGQSVGSFVDVEVWNAANGLGFAIGDNVLPTFGPRGQIMAVVRP